MNSLLEAIKAAAEKATPGKWEKNEYSNYPNGYSVYADSGCIAERWQDGLNDTQQQTLRDTGAYIALCSPENILALVKALEEARELAEFLEKTPERSYGHCSCCRPGASEKARAFLEKHFKNE